MMILDHYPTMEKPERFTSSRLQADKVKMCSPLVVESEELVGYVRMGGCTAGCGACCEAFVVPIKAEGLEDKDFAPVIHGQIVLPVGLPVQADNKDAFKGFDDWEHWLVLHNVYLFQESGGLLTAAIPVEAKSAAPARDFDAWVVWLKAHGITMLRRTGRLLAYVPVPCGPLKDDGTCDLFGSPQRPRTCLKYPEHPQDIEGLEFCTYRFRPIQRDELQSLAARPKPPQSKKRKKGKRKKKR